MSRPTDANENRRLAPALRENERLENQNHSAHGEAETKTKNDVKTNLRATWADVAKIQDGEHPDLDTTQKE
jgi:hypothetical protein